MRAAASAAVISAGISKSFWAVRAWPQSRD
jgi:hypothetical protein